MITAMDETAYADKWRTSLKTKGRTRVQDKVLSVMRDGRWRTANDVARALKMSPDSVANYLRAAATEGRLRREARLGVMIYQVQS